MNRLAGAAAALILLVACSSPVPPQPTVRPQSSLPTPSATPAPVTPPAKPMVACESAATSCVRETLAVLDAVASVGHPATRITFRANAMCIWTPFHTGPCGSIAVPDGTQKVTSAVVSFSGTEQQAFLNLFRLTDGSLRRDMALVTPPPGATPFP
jgi:hypothetical protein